MSRDNRRFSHGPRIETSATTIPVHIETSHLTVSLSPPWLQQASQFWNYLTKATTLASPQIILNDISMSIPPGKLTVILGGSGSGKTSLLNALSGRTRNGNVMVTGDITYNRNPDITAFCSSFIAQQDILPAVLTVRETLQYAAELRLRRERGMDNITRAIEDVIASLSLGNCLGTQIGDGKQKGCSGGEKRRVSIGTQLLNHASLLFCDEPTTGLDAATALHVVRTLKKLANLGVTVVASVHAPRSDSWDIFDNVILLSRGHLLYSGPTTTVTQWLQFCGYEMPSFMNPADFLLDIASANPATTTSQPVTQSSFEYLRLCWSKYSSSNTVETPDGLWADSERKHHIPSLLAVCSVMTRRSLNMMLRDWKSLLGMWCAVIFLALVNGWIFWQVDGTLAGIRSREGSLWAATVLYGYLIMISEICRLLKDIKLFDHERRDGVVSSLVFLLSRRAAKLFFEDIPLPTVFTGIYYSMVGYQKVSSQIGVFFLVMLLTHYLAIGFATVCVATTRSFYGAGVMGNLFFTLQMVGSAYCIQIDQIPRYARWLKWLTHTFYAFGALCTNEFIGIQAPNTGRIYDCPYSSDPTDPRCKEYTGTFILDSLGLPEDWMWIPITVLFAITIIFHTTAAAILHYKEVKPNLSQKSQHHSNNDNNNACPAPISDSQDYRPTPLDVSLKDYCLLVESKEQPRPTYSHSRSQIFGPLSTMFPSGKLNVIMGASGSGKTSLLTSLCGRLSTPISNHSKFHLTGSVFYNGERLEESATRACISFVSQDDDNLIPTLTVQETLLFAAHMKLPPSMLSREKKQRVQQVMTKFGLRSCANSLVGSTLTRGISGGEKRRLSIACQLLTLPQVLVLDEPTSGLDSFTALSITKLLQDLALEGHTIILTVHQPTSSMWQLFDNCLLLAPQGLPLYSGPTSSMQCYFDQLGFPCPTKMNPADYFMDVVTFDPAEEGEHGGQERVQRLLRSWIQHQSAMDRDSSDNHQYSLETYTRTKQPRFLLQFQQAFPILLHRSALCIIRQPLAVLARSVQAPGVALILALFVAPLKTDYLSVQTRMGFTQQFSTLPFIGMIQNVAAFPPQQETFFQEAFENIYGPEVFLAQYTVLEVPFEMFSALIFSLLAAYASGLGSTARLFGIMFLNSFCLLNTGESISMIFLLLIPHVSVAVNVTSALLAIWTVLGGIMSLDPPKVLQWFNYLSPIRHAITNISIFTLRDLKFTCTDAQRRVDGTCPFQNGKQVLQTYNLDKNDPQLELVAVVVLMVGTRLLVLIILKIKSQECWSAFIRKYRSRKWNMASNGAQPIELTATTSV